MVYIVWAEYRHQQLHVANTKLPWKPFIQQHFFLDSAGRAQAVSAKATFSTQEAQLYLSLCFNLFFFSSAAEEKWEGKAVPLPKSQTHTHTPMHHSSFQPTAPPSKHVSEKRLRKHKPPFGLSSLRSHLIVVLCWGLPNEKPPMAKSHLLRGGSPQLLQASWHN